MRVFIALPLPLSFKSDLLNAVASISAAHPDFRWQSADQLHLTLAFLGELDQPRIELAEDCLRRTIAELELRPFRLALDSVISFPPRGKVRIVAAAVGDGAAACGRLAEKLENRLAEAGRQRGLPFRAPENRPFSAHLTLARVKDGYLSAAERAFPLHLSTEIGSAAVFASSLSPSGSVYSILVGCPFGASSGGASPELISPMIGGK